MLRAYPQSPFTCLFVTGLTKTLSRFLAPEVILSFHYLLFLTTLLHAKVELEGLKKTCSHQKETVEYPLFYNYSIDYIFYHEFLFHPKLF